VTSSSRVRAVERVISRSRMALGALPRVSVMDAAFESGKDGSDDDDGDGDKSRTYDDVVSTCPLAWSGASGSPRMWPRQGASRLCMGLSS
jgi:hypothetical protein